MQPVDAILKLRSEFAARLRDRATWQEVRIDPRGRLAQLPHDILQYVIDPYFEDLRRPAPNTITYPEILAWEEKYCSYPGLRLDMEKLNRDFPLPVPSAGYIDVKFVLGHVCIANSHSVWFYKYNTDMAAPGPLVRCLPGNLFYFYLGDGLFSSGSKNHIDCNSQFFTVAGKRASPFRNVFAEIKYFVPVQILPCGLLHVRKGRRNYLVDIAANTCEQIAILDHYSYAVTDDYGKIDVKNHKTWSISAVNMHSMSTV